MVKNGDFFKVNFFYIIQNHTKNHTNVLNLNRRGFSAHNTENKSISIEYCPVQYVWSFICALLLAIILYIIYTFIVKIIIFLTAKNFAYDFYESL